MLSIAYSICKRYHANTHVIRNVPTDKISTVYPHDLTPGILVVSFDLRYQSDIVKAEDIDTKNRCHYEATEVILPPVVVPTGYRRDTTDGGIITASEVILPPVVACMLPNISLRSSIYVFVSCDSH